LAMINALGKASSLVGLSGSAYVYDPLIAKACERGELADVGYGESLDIERMVGLDPDVVFVYGVEGSEVGIYEKLTELGLPLVYCGEYLESSPLGKAEWIRFFAAFYQLEKEADHLFGRIDSSYQSLARLASGLEDRPGILSGLPWKDSWYVAGGQSFAAKLISDAGADYLWKENTSSEAFPMDLEAVYTKALMADIWINPGAARSLQDIYRVDERFGELEVWKRGRVFNNDARMGPGGGNDYWESGVVRPDLILADLIRIFHPDILPEHESFYYRQLK